MQTWLTIEQNDVAVNEMPLDYISHSQPVRNRSPISETQKLFVIPSRNEISAGVNVRAIPNSLPQVLDIMRSDSLWVCKNFGDTLGNSDLIDAQVGIRGNDSSTREIHALSGKIASETTLLSLQSLYEATDGFLAHL